MTVKARITCENRPGLLPPFSTHAFNCRRAQLRTEEGEGLVSRLFVCIIYICMYMSRLGMQLFRAQRANVRITCVGLTNRNVAY